MASARVTHCPRAGRALLPAVSRQRILHSLEWPPCCGPCCVKRIQSVAPSNRFQSTYCVSDTYTSLSSHALWSPVSPVSLQMQAAMLGELASSLESRPHPRSPGPACRTRTTSCRGCAAPG